MAASVVAALLLGLLLRLWFVFGEGRIAGDALIYGEIARNVIQHHVYGFSAALNGVAMAPHPTLIRSARVPAVSGALLPCVWDGAVHGGVAGAGGRGSWDVSAAGGDCAADVRASRGGWRRFGWGRCVRSWRTMWLRH